MLPTPFLHSPHDRMLKTLRLSPQLLDIIHHVHIPNFRTLSSPTQSIPSFPNPTPPTQTPSAPTNLPNSTSPLLQILPIVTVQITNSSPNLPITHTTKPPQLQLAQHTPFPFPFLSTLNPTRFFSCPPPLMILIFKFLFLISTSMCLYSERKKISFQFKTTSRGIKVVG